MSAPQDQNGRNNNFDFLRFVGALLVFVSHATFIPTGTLWADPLYKASHGQMTSAGSAWGCSSSSAAF